MITSWIYEKNIIEKHFLEIFCSEVFPETGRVEKKTLENAIYKPLSKMISETVTYDPFPPHPKTKIETTKKDPIHTQNNIQNDIVRSRPKKHLKRQFTNLLPK